MLCCTTRLRVAPVCAQWRSSAAASARSSRTETIVPDFVIHWMVMQYSGAVHAVCDKSGSDHDFQPELVRRDKLALVKNPLNVPQEIELAPVAGRSGHLREILQKRDRLIDSPTGGSRRDKFDIMISTAF